MGYPILSLPAICYCGVNTRVWYTNANSDRDGHAEIDLAAGREQPHCTEVIVTKPSRIGEIEIICVSSRKNWVHTCHVI